MTLIKYKLYLGTLIVCYMMSMINIAAVEQPKKIGWRTLYQLDYQTGEAPPYLKSLDGEIVRIPGFIVPLEGDEKTITEFLLVPTYGACVHVPPPPPNQIVHVISEKGIDSELMYYPVWITGQLNIANTQSELAEASFSMNGLKAEEYEE